MLWPLLTPPQPTLADRLVLLLYLVPIGVSAGLRALLWVLRVNMAGLPFCSPAREVRWADNLPRAVRRGPASAGARGGAPQGDTLPAIMRVLVDRRAQRIPHAGARPFTAHITGVANLLGAWEQPWDVCLVGRPAPPAHACGFLAPVAPVTGF